MRHLLRICLLALALLPSLAASAQHSDRLSSPTLNVGEGLTTDKSELLSKRNNKQNKNSRVLDIYMFAASYSLVDSLLFISDVQKVENVTLNNKWFLVDRAKYEAQYSDFIGSEFNETMISVVYFAKKEKPMARRKEHILKRNEKKVHFEVDLTPDFIFEQPEQD